jgi:hypothetical protein
LRQGRRCENKQREDSPFNDVHDNLREYNTATFRS